MNPKQIVLADMNSSIAIGILLGLLAVVAFVVVKYRNEVLGLIQKVKTFLLEVYGELRKSTWPTWIELRDSTIVVIIAVALLATFVGVADLLFSYVIKFLTEQG